MSKIDIIDYCGDCSKRYYEGSDLHCEITEGKVAENMPCPPNCPLKDSDSLLELEILRHRVKWCETADEAEKMAFIRALQEIARAVGISAAKSSPEQIVEAVKRVNQ